MTKGTSPLKQPACLPLADEGPAQGRAGPGPSSRPRLSPSPPPPCSGGAPAGLHPSQPGGEGEADPLFPDRRCVEARPGGRESSGSPAPHGVCVPGSLINTIRVLCASYEDYSRWLLCLQTVSRRGGAPLLPNPETFPGLRMPHQVRCLLPTAGQQGAAGPGEAGRRSCHALTPLPCCPGPGQWPGLTLFRWTDQLGLRVPRTPLDLHQPLPPRVLSAAHCGPPCPACTCECLGVQTEERDGGLQGKCGKSGPHSAPSQEGLWLLTRGDSD